MREILFRGKRKDTGEWVYGDLVRLKDGRKSIPHIYGYGEVIPETVGQYTGHTDMKRKKIFEDDIVQRYKKEFTPPRKYKNPYVVDMTSCFPCAVEEYYSAFEHFTEKVCYEVIGNVHDNKELLEVSK